MLRTAALAALAALVAAAAVKGPKPLSNSCAQLPSHDVLQAELKAAVKPSGGPSNGGFDLNMWASIVDPSGIVCAVAYSGNAVGDQWLGSRQIAAVKATTANSFSLPGLALSTANLFSAVQAGGSLYGLHFSNLEDAHQGLAGEFSTFGTSSDPLVGTRIGGANNFGGGLSLYAKTPNGIVRVGGLGVSGDSSCADHNVAWRVRQALGLNANINSTSVSGVAGKAGDAIIYDITVTGANSGVSGASPSGWGHPQCSKSATSVGLSIGAAIL